MAKPEGTQSIRRAFQLLKLFSDEKPRWTLAELVQETALKQTTVFRILSSLEYEGVIRRADSGAYQLGSEMIALGGRAVRSNRLREVAQPHLRALNALTKESIGLDILWIEDNVAQSMAIDEVLGHHLIGTTQYIGARLPAHTTSTGKALLAHQPSDVLTQLQTTALTQLTRATQSDWQAFSQELATIREQGYATTDGDLESGLRAVAAPVFNQHREIVAAVCTSGPETRIDAKKLTQFIQYTTRTARDISRALGYRDQDHTAKDYLNDNKI